MESVRVRTVLHARQLKGGERGGQRWLGRLTFIKHGRGQKWLRIP